VDSEKKASALESVVTNAIGFAYTVALSMIFSDQDFWKSAEFSSFILVLNIIRSFVVSVIFKKIRGKD